MYLVVLEHSKLDLLPLVLVLLGGGVGLLLPLLGTTTQPQYQVQSGLLQKIQHNGSILGYLHAMINQCSNSQPWSLGPPVLHIIDVTLLQHT